MGAISLICGIVGIILTFVPGINIWFSVAVGAVGIVLAAIGKKNGEKGLATAGLVLSIIAISVAVLVIAVCAGAEKAVNDAFSSL